MSGDRRTPFYVGQPMADVLKIIRRTGRKPTRPPKVVNPDEIRDLTQDDLEVRWYLSCGAILTIGQGRGPDGKGDVCDRILRIDWA